MTMRSAVPKSTLCALHVKLAVRKFTVKEWKLMLRLPLLRLNALVWLMKKLLPRLSSPVSRMKLLQPLPMKRESRKLKRPPRLTKRN